MFSGHHKPMKIFLTALSFPSERKQKVFYICALADYNCNFYQGNEDSQDKFHQWTSINMRWFTAGKRCCFSHGIGHQPTTYFATSHKEKGLQHLIPLNVWAGNFKALCLADDWIPAPTEQGHNRTAHRAVLLRSHLQPQLSQGPKFHLQPNVLSLKMLNDINR